MSNRLTNTPFLRLALLGDATASGATGLLMSAAADPLSQLLNLPKSLLLGAGLILLPYAAAVGWLGSRSSLDARAVWVVIAINALWVVESLLLLVLGWVQPTTLGTAFIVAQAAAVAIFAELQFIALRRVRRGHLAAA